MKTDINGISSIQRYVECVLEEAFKSKIKKMKWIDEKYNENIVDELITRDRNEIDSIRKKLVMNLSIIKTKLYPKFAKYRTMLISELSENGEDIRYDPECVKFRDIVYFFRNTKYGSIDMSKIHISYLVDLLFNAHTYRSSNFTKIIREAILNTLIISIDASSMIDESMITKNIDGSDFLMTYCPWIIGRLANEWNIQSVKDVFEQVDKFIPQYDEYMRTRIRESFVRNQNVELLYRWNPIVVAISKCDCGLYYMLKFVMKEYVSEFDKIYNKYMKEMFEQHFDYIYLTIKSNRDTVNKSMVLDLIGHAVSDEQKNKLAELSGRSDK